LDSLFLYIKLQIVDALSLFPFYPDFDHICQEELITRLKYIV